MGGVVEEQNRLQKRDKIRFQKEKTRSFQQVYSCHSSVLIFNFPSKSKPDISGI